MDTATYEKSYSKYISTKIYQYELQTALYMLEPWEKALFSKKPSLTLDVCNRINILLSFCRYYHALYRRLICLDHVSIHTHCLQQVADLGHSPIILSSSSSSPMYNL